MVTLFEVLSLVFLTTSLKNAFGVIAVLRC